MYDRHLEAFVKVVELGSFSKAAEILFISATAIIKQINHLERALGLTLLERSHAGVSPTPAGHVLYEGALDIMERSHEIVEHARNAAASAPQIVRLSVSVLRPARTIASIWRSKAKNHPNVKLSTVRVADDFETWCATLRKLGEDIDVSVAITPCGNAPWMECCEALEIYHEPLCVLVPASHRLASKERLSIEDLHGERISMAPRGTTPYVDELCDYLAVCHPSVVPNARPPYDLAEFNRCASENELLLGCRDWADIHPEMLNKEVDWGDWHGTLGFSVLFPQKPSPQVREFVDTICEGHGIERANLPCAEHPTALDSKTPSG